MKLQKPDVIPGYSLAKLRRMSGPALQKVLDETVMRMTAVAHRDLFDAQTECGKTTVDLVRARREIELLNEQNERLRRTVAMKTAAIHSLSFLLPKSHEEAARQFARFDAVQRPAPYSDESDNCPF